MTAPTLTEFLLARIAEDEADARDTAQAIHWPAERLLAECEAKRRIVDAFEDERQRMDIYNRDYRLGLLPTEGDLKARHSSNARWAGLEIAMRSLAAVYSDHPDYDEAWRP